MASEITPGALVALVSWYREMGVDCAVGEAPTDWLTRGDRAPGHGYRWPGSGSEPDLAVPARLEPPPPAARPQPPRPPMPAAAVASRPVPAGAPPPRPAADEGVMAARALAGKAATLEALEAALKAFEGCPLKATAKSLCFYRGSPQARLMIVGEAPGRDEDLAGKPFVGRAGQLLDRMLAAIGLTEADVHITNTVYWRPPGNRTPTPQETLACWPFLERQIELVGPRVILTLGGPATKSILGVADGIMKVRGTWREYRAGDRTIPVMATLHPAYLLRTPIAKRMVWRDLRALKAKLET